MLLYGPEKGEKANWPNLLLSAVVSSHSCLCPSDRPVFTGQARPSGLLFVGKQSSLSGKAKISNCENSFQSFVRGSPGTGAL